jgi:hypothetical protein
LYGKLRGRDCRQNLEAPAVTAGKQALYVRGRQATTDKPKVYTGVPSTMDATMKLGTRAVL